MKKSLIIKISSIIFIILSFAVCFGTVFAYDGYYDYYEDYYPDDYKSDVPLPDWYPENPNSFVDFHGKNLPHVKDDADMFTDSEEARLSALIETLVAKHGYDFVLFTDVSSRGLGEDVYAADFYQFNGYGIDDEYSGSVLYICMDPRDRCYFTAACGKCEDIYGDEVIGSIDDFFYDYMAAGRYYDGIVEYIKFIDDVYTLPDWYPENVIPQSGNYSIPSIAGNAIDKSKPHIIDNSGIYSPAEEQEMSDLISAFIDKKNVDFVVLTEDSTKCILPNIYARDFYAFNGYAENGMIVLVSKDTYGYAIQDVYAFGSCAKKVNKNAGKFGSKGFVGREESYIKDVSFLLTAGFMPITFGGSALSLLGGGGLGLIVANSKSKKKERDMLLPTGSSARSYEVKDSLKMKNIRTTVLYTSVSKTRKAPPPSSGGSGGSHSSHSGSSRSFSSSGGRSFSGGGRHF